MAIEKMTLVRFYGRLDCLNAVLPQCMESGCFHPEAASTSTRVGGFAPVSETNPYDTMLNQLKEVSEVAGVSLSENVDRLIESHYLEIRFGRLPSESLPLLSGSDERFEFIPLSKDDDYQRGFYITTEDDLPEVEDVLDGLGFIPEGEAVRYSVLSGESPYNQVIAHMNEVAALAGLSATENSDDFASDISIEPSDTDRFINEFRGKFIELTEMRKELENFLAENVDALTFIEHFGDFNENLDDLFGSEYYKIRFGRLPVGSFDKLSYYADKMFLFFSLTEDKHYHWGFFLTTSEDYAEIMDIFNSLDFERIWIPNTIHGTPESAREQLRRMIDQTERDIVELDAQLTALVNDNKDFFLSVYTTLNRLNSAFALRKYVGEYGNMFHLEGFVPKSESERFAELFANIPGLEITFQPHDSDRRLQVPTKLKNNRIWKPFEMFVEMYGLPGYNELDPTTFLGITYTLLFGIMFGDLGQGILIAIFGYVLWKVRKMALGSIMIRIGISSAVFGLVYGSVFGLEHVLDPLYKAIGFAEKPFEVMSPLSINTILLTAIGIGVALIISTILINIWQGIRNRDIERAFFSNNGLAGLIFYGGILAGAVCMLTGGPNLFTPAYIIVVLVVPIVVIFLKESLTKVIRHEGKFLPEDEGIGSWILEGFFELFEIVLSFLTNTLSFLRVGGFIISHAGMMMVVMTLAEMMRGAGNIAVLIFGNLFVIGLEGFIVGIQVLRLQFYELFSHYYEGQGKAFEPVTK
ncbi:MAG: ATPase [Oscillospiraceae bacterium]|nr:ATPase [Oscillospiraceae bacterium]